MKLYVLSGPGIAKSAKHIKTLTSPALLKAVAEVETIGARQGFEITELKDVFNPDETDYSIVINAHGEINNAGYQIITKISPSPQVDERPIVTKTLAKGLITAIKESTHSKPVKIFSIACYGENMHDNIDLLPPLSQIITLSDKDSIGFALDSLGVKLEEELTQLSAVNFKLEHLLEIFCLNQRFGQTTPVISKKLADGTIQMNNLAEYTESYIKQTQFDSSPLQQFNSFFNGPKIEERAKNLIEQIKQGKKVVDFKLPTHIANMVLENYEKSAIVNFNTSLEKDFYYNGALKEFDYPYILKPYREWLENKSNIARQLQNEEFQGLPDTEQELYVLLSSPLPLEIATKISRKAEMLSSLRTIENEMKMKIGEGSWGEDFRSTPVHLQCFNADEDHPDQESAFTALSIEDLDHPISNYSVLLALGAEALADL